MSERDVKKNFPVEVVMEHYSVKDCTELQCHVVFREVMSSYMSCLPLASCMVLIHYLPF
jgi:hypothetical protein